MRRILQDTGICASGAVHSLPEGLLEQELQKAYENQKPMRIKLGVDPTSQDLHYGHAVVLRKMRQFQDLGHQVILIIGDYTALVGDPSGQNKIRKILTLEQILENAKTYQEQAFLILDREKTEVVYNSQWLSALTMQETIGLLQKVSLAQILEREDFSKRYAAGKPISMSELLYPILQGYDSVAVQADVELGGQDQVFNLLMGREIQKIYQQKPQAILTVPLLIGTDGKQKMSKSYGNFIGLTESSKDIFGKIMSIPDDIILHYLQYMAFVTPSELAEYEQRFQSGENPKILKSELAKRVLSLSFEAAEVERVAEEFEQMFSKKKIAIESLEKLAASQFYGRELVDTLVEFGGISSKSEARRLIQQKAISYDQQTIEDIKYIWKEEEMLPQAVWKVGKKTFFSICK